MLFETSIRTLKGVGEKRATFCNDIDPSLVFAQQVLARGKAGDIFIGTSTSGNAVIGLTGEKGGTLRDLADVCIRVPETETFKVQELHLPVYHCLCAAVEAHFFVD